MEERKETKHDRKLVFMDLGNLYPTSGCKEEPSEDGDKGHAGKYPCHQDVNRLFWFLVRHPREEHGNDVH